MVNIVSIYILGCIKMSLSRTVGNATAIFTCHEHKPLNIYTEYMPSLHAIFIYMWSRFMHKWGMPLT